MRIDHEWALNFLVNASGDDINLEVSSASARLIPEGCPQERYRGLLAGFHGLAKYVDEEECDMGQLLLQLLAINQTATAKVIPDKVTAESTGCSLVPPGESDEFYTGLAWSATLLTKCWASVASEKPGIDDVKSWLAVLALRVAQLFID